ncbi:MAG: hypothetical protein AABW87_03910 [Nanoarchaeota archaeon]
MKGQTEIVGLVVIVMLLLFAGLLYLKLSATEGRVGKFREGFPTIKG